MRTVFPAGEGSSWLPLRDATWLLPKLRVRTRPGGPSRALLSKPTSQRKGGPVRLSIGARTAMGLRTFACLTDASVETLEGALPTQAGSPVFVSYRTADGQRPATELVHALSTRVPVWFDDWSLPSRLTELQPRDTREGIRGALSRAIAGAARSVRVRTEGYEKSEWTREESPAIARRGEVIDWRPDEESLGDVVARVMARHPTGGETPRDEPR